MVPDFSDVLGRLSSGTRRESLTHRAVLPAREAETADWPTWLHPDVRDRLGAAGIAAPWTHQRRAAEAAWRGEHVVLATGTASGKSLGYRMPALTAILDGRTAGTRRNATVLYLAPTKALAHDQAQAIAGLGVGVRVATHDGDASPEQRRWTRDHGEFVLTNPDMLHHSMLPDHERWARFWRACRFVVVDECHHYRGVFGAHVAHILRRLRRVCAHHGADPTFVLASATVAEPADAASRLTGLEVAEITADGSPRGRLHVGLWEPPLLEGEDPSAGVQGENGAPVRRAATTEAAGLLTDLVVEGVRTLAFVRSRRGTEVVAARAAHLLDEVDPGLGSRVAAYRGGYLPEERRALEGSLRSGDLLGVAATNALELGIDIAGLDAVLIAGFPGTRAAFWQQLGRAGRGGQDALGILIARDDPLDTYLAHHPEALLGRPVERNVFDPANPYVLGPHLCAAAQEIPLTVADVELFGETTPTALDALTAQGMLRRRPAGWFWTHDRRASDLADLRSTGGPAVALVEEETGRVVGHVDAAAAHSTAHPGAVYLHQGDQWEVESLDLEHHVAMIRRSAVEWSTSAREVTDIGIVAEHECRDWGACRLSVGEVEVSHQVVSFLRRRTPGGEVLGEEPLDLPVRTLRTRAVWWTVPRTVWSEAGMAETELPGAAHAAEHCAIGLLPLFATCDRWDIGGVSTAHHRDTGELTVFVYDGHPGGAGFAERGYRTAAAWLRATREAIAACGCHEGCPSCVQSPKCGNQNNPLDKSGAVRLLDLVLAESGLR